MTGFRLSTARTLCTLPAPEDLPHLRRIATAPEVGRMLFLFSPAMTDDDFAGIFPLRAEAPPFRLAIRAGGQVIGSVGIGPGREAAVYYFLDPASAGRGLASEVVCAFCDAILDSFPAIAALTAEVFDDNPASARILTRAGFTCTGAARLRSAMRLAPEAGTAWRRAR